MEFIANDRGYSSYTWKGGDEHTHIDPVAEKLLTGDIVTLDGIQRTSIYRTRTIPGVLVLNGSTFGRKKTSFSTNVFLITSLFQCS